MSVVDLERNVEARTPPWKGETQKKKLEGRATKSLKRASGGSRKKQGRWEGGGKRQRSRGRKVGAGAGGEEA